MLVLRSLVKTYGCKREVTKAQRKQRDSEEGGGPSQKGENAVMEVLTESLVMTIGCERNGSGKAFKRRL